jgi:hypothetical protein
MLLEETSSQSRFRYLCCDLEAIWKTGFCTVTSSWCKGSCWLISTEFEFELHCIPVHGYASYGSKLQGSYFSFTIRRLFNFLLIANLQLCRIESRLLDVALIYLYAFCVIMWTRTCARKSVKKQNQSANPLWHTLRYSRITASTLHEIAHAQDNVNLKCKILGANKIPLTDAIDRGKRIEDDM